MSTQFKMLSGAAIGALVATTALAQTATESETAATEPAADMQEMQFTVADLLGMDVAGETGDSVGEIDYVYQTDGAYEAVIGVGGFLGLGEYTVALPLDRFERSEDGLMIAGLTEDELRDMPQIDESGLESLPDDHVLDGFQNLAVAPDMNADEMVETELAEAGEAIEAGAEDAAMETADALDATGEAIEAGVEDVATAAENAGVAIEAGAEEAATETADAAEATGDAIEAGAEDAAQIAENAGEAIEAGAEEAATEMADATESVELGAEDTAAELIAEPEMAGTDEAIATEADPMTAEVDAANVDGTMFSGMTVSDILGMEVIAANGEDVGEIDYVIEISEGVAAVIGIGGFLGLGEYTVALPLDSFELGEEDKLQLSTLTEDQLRGMPEIDESALNPLDASVILN